jgi:hypothetical protein
MFKKVRIIQNIFGLLPMENFEKRIFQLKQDEGNTVGEANLKVYI